MAVGGPTGPNSSKTPLEVLRFWGHLMVLRRQKGASLKENERRPCRDDQLLGEKRCFELIRQGVEFRPPVQSLPNLADQWIS